MFPLTVWGAIWLLRTNRNDVKEWLPETFEATQDYQEFQRHFGDEAFVLVSWDGCTLDDPRLGELAHLLLDPPGAGTPHYFAKAVTGASVLDRLIEPPTNLDYDVAIARLEGTLIGPDGRQSCLILTLSDLGRENLRKALDQIYSLAQEHLHLGRHEVRMGGPPVDNVAIDLEGERMLLRLMVLSGAIGLSLAWWYLRDVRLTAMVLVGGIYSAALCLSLVYVLGGTMNSILLTMPSVVYTTGLAAAMHIVNYYRHGRDTEGLENSAGRALRDSWIPCSLSAGTTALGLISLCISDLVPIRNFGAYTALGVAATVFFMFLYLPSALQMWPPKSDKGTREYSNAVHLRRMHAVGTYLIARRRLIWVVFIVALVACGTGLRRARTTINLMSLFSPDAEIIHSYSWLEKHLGPLVPMEVVVRFDTRTNDQSLLDRMRIVEEIQQAAHAIPAVGGTMSAATFAPELSIKPAGGLRGAVVAQQLSNRAQQASDRASRGVCRRRLPGGGSQTARGTVARQPASCRAGRYRLRRVHRSDPRRRRTRLGKRAAQRRAGAGRNHLYRNDAGRLHGRTGAAQRTHRELCRGLRHDRHRDEYRAARHPGWFADDAAQRFSHGHRVWNDELAGHRAGYWHDDDRQRGHGRVRR